MSTHPQTKAPTEQNGHHAIVLIVDDNESGRYAMAHCLRKAGHQVLQAGSGEECFRLLAENQPELVLLDIKLPDASGIEICRRLKANPATANIPVIQISALFTATHDRIEGLESGADAYLTAPFEPRELLAQVNALLRIRQAEAAVREAKDELARHARALEETVRRRTAELQTLVNDLEHFSYTITHDMRAPLRAMRGFAELVNEGEEGLEEPERKMYLQRIISAAERMDNLITDALNYSRAVRERLPLGPVDVSALLRDMLESYPEYMPDRADIRLELPATVVLGNSAALTQCFSNLLTNAVRFTRPGTRAQVRIWAEEVAGTATAGMEYVRIWVEDQGIGISERMLPKVFDMFSRGSHDHEGTGIGLALVRKVVERMGGRVGVKSELGKGSRFWVELKQVEA